MVATPVVNVMELRAARDREIAAREREIEEARVAGDPRANLRARHQERIGTAAALDKATSAAAEAAKLVNEAEQHHQSLLDRRRAHDEAAAAALAEQIAAGETVTPAVASSDMSAALEVVVGELRLGKGALERLEARRVDARNVYDAAVRAEQTSAMALLVDIAIHEAERVLETIAEVEEDRAELAAMVTEIKRARGPVPTIVNQAVFGQLAKAYFTRESFAGMFEQLIADPDFGAAA
jgi:hypothetical protein